MIIFEDRTKKCKERRPIKKLFELACNYFHINSHIGLHRMWHGNGEDVCQLQWLIDSTTTPLLMDRSKLSTIIDDKEQYFHDVVFSDVNRKNFFGIYDAAFLFIQGDNVVAHKQIASHFCKVQESDDLNLGYGNWSDSRAHLHTRFPVLGKVFKELGTFDFAKVLAIHCSNIIRQGDCFHPFVSDFVSMLNEFASHRNNNYLPELSNLPFIDVICDSKPAFEFVIPNLNSVARERFDLHRKMWNSASQYGIVKNYEADHVLGIYHSFSKD